MQNVYVLGLDRTLDAEARVERLVAEHEAKLARYVRRFVNDGDFALDIVQDVYFAAYRMLRADPSRPLSAGWLYKTATNYAISHLRKKKRRGETLPLEAGRGLALFLRRGMWGWARAVGTPTASPRTTRVALARSSADDEQRAIIHLFAAMAVRSTNPRTHERIT